MGWLIVGCLLLVGASALLTDLQLHQTASTCSRIQAILRPADQDSTPSDGSDAPTPTRPGGDRGSTRRPGRDRQPGHGGATVGGEVEGISFAVGHPESPWPGARQP